MTKLTQLRLCGCEKPGPFNCDLPGILAGRPQKKGYRYIERCDMCERYPNDEAACEAYVGIMGGRPCYDRQRKVIWVPK